MNDKASEAIVNFNKRVTEEVKELNRCEEVSVDRFARCLTYLALGLIELNCQIIKDAELPEETIKERLSGYVEEVIRGLREYTSHENT